MMDIKDIFQSYDPLKNYSEEVAEKLWNKEGFTKYIEDMSEGLSEEHKKEFIRFSNEVRDKFLENFEKNLDLKSDTTTTTPNNKNR